MKTITTIILWLLLTNIYSQKPLFIENKYYLYIRDISIEKLELKYKVLTVENKTYHLTKVYAVENYDELLIVASYLKEEKDYFNIIQRNEIKR